MSNTEVTKNTFNGRAAGERVVVVEGMRDRPFVSIDMHNQDKVVSIDLANIDALALSLKIREMSMVPGVELEDGLKMSHAVEAMSEAVTVADSLGFSNLASMITALMGAPIQDPNILPVLYALTGANR